MISLWMWSLLVRNMGRYSLRVRSVLLVPSCHPHQSYSEIWFIKRQPRHAQCRGRHLRLGIGNVNGPNDGLLALTGSWSSCYIPGAALFIAQHESKPLSAMEFLWISCYPVGFQNFPQRKPFTRLLDLIDDASYRKSFQRDTYSWLSHVVSESYIYHPYFLSFHSLLLQPLFPSYPGTSCSTGVFRISDSLGPTRPWCDLVSYMWFSHPST